MRKFVAVLFLSGLLSACGPSPGSGSLPSPGPTSPVVSSSPSATSSPTLPAGFDLVPVSGGSVGDSTVTAVRVGQQSGYDRFVIEFGGGVPNYSVTPQGTPTFTRSPKGDQVTLEGTTGVLIVVHSVTNWTSYSGPTSFKPGYSFLREAALVENFEGYQQWAIGVRGTACVRVTTLGSPSRLVVDVIGI